MGKCVSRVASAKKNYSMIDHLYDIDEVGIANSLISKGPSF